MPRPKGFTRKKRKGMHSKTDSGGNGSDGGVPKPPTIDKSTPEERKNKVVRHERKMDQPPPSHKAVRYNLRSATDNGGGEKGIELVREIVPPATPDIEFISMVSGPATCRHIEIDMGDIGTDPIRLEQSQMTLKFFGQTAPNDMLRMIRDGVVIEGKIEKWMMNDNFFQTKSQKNPNSRPANGGVYRVDFANLLNLTIPTQYIGMRPGAKEDLSCVPAKGTPAFHENLRGKVATLKFDRGPYYAFERHGNHYICAIDYLHLHCFVRAFRICNGNLYNFLPIVLMACHGVYNRLYQQSLEGEKPLSRQQKTVVETTIIPVCVQLDEIMEGALEEQHAKGVEGIRRHWLTWNPFLDEHDRYYKPAMQAFRKSTRERFYKDRMIDNSDIKLRSEQMALLSNVLIMIPSGSCRDEACERAFYDIINSRHDGMSFLGLLSKRPMKDFLRHFSELYEPHCGMHRLKAHSLLTFLVPLEVLYGGEVPLEMLHMFPQVHAKKRRIVQNAQGLYRGVGADTWVIRFFSLFIEGTKSAKAKIALAIAGTIPLHPGLNLNDNIGELCQQYRKGGKGKAWAEGVLARLAEKSEAFAEVLDDLFFLLESKK